MNKNFSSFFGGFFTVLLAAGCLNTALAASGKVSYNFSSVALNGETKITAGQDITAANGQKVPGTILFTDAAGGKTNYLPIRAVSELLGVEIGYDSASKTVLLGGQPAAEPAEPASTAETVSGRQWQRERELDPTNGGIYYTWPRPKETQDYDALPALRPTWLPEGYLLKGNGVGREGVRNDSLTWTYVKDETSGSKITFTCYRPTNRSRGFNFGIGLDTAALRRDAAVQGRSADFYQIYEDVTVLVWEDAAGNLFWLRGTQDQATYEKIAASVKDVQDDPLPALTFGWTPEGFALDPEGGLTAPATVAKTWAKVTQGPPKITEMFYWTYSREALYGPTTAEPESVKVNGAQARYWPGNLNAKGNTASAGGTVTAVSTSADQLGTLLWTDPETEIHFCLEAPFDRDTMIRMAESVTRK